MSLPADYHMHTPLCRHADGEPTEYAAAAKEKGLTEIGFTDHSPMEKDGHDDWRMLRSELDTYVEKVEQARADHPDLTILLSLEVDYLPEHEAWIRELAQAHPWDYFLGSVHYLDAWDIDNPKKISEWEKRDPWDVWQAYFDRLTQAAASGLFEIIGHADLPKKFCFYPKEDCRPMFTRFLEAAAATNTAIELNTAGLRKACKEIYPSPTILQIAKQSGVHITFGSDAHAPDEVGADFHAAIALAQEVGYTQSLRFRERKGSLIRF